MAKTMSLKGRISSPLEAGQSILDGTNLPPHVHSALEYAARRLARKNMHLTLVVVRKDYQLPTAATVSPPFYLDAASPLASVASPSLSSPTPAFSVASTPSRSPFGLTSSVKNPVRHSNPAIPAIAGRSRSPPSSSSTNLNEQAFGENTVDPQRYGMASPACSVSSSISAVSRDTGSIFSTRGFRFKWPQSPFTPIAWSSASVPPTPATPCTIVSSVTSATDAESAVASDQAGVHGQDSVFGIKLVHVGPLSLKEEKMLKCSLSKAGRKFDIGQEWLSNAVAPSACGLNVDVIHRSIKQNEELFVSEGLTLLSLDHLYTFKAALALYTRTLSPCRLEDAVDELRRLVLAQGRRRLRRSILFSTHTWLEPISDAALADVMCMYQRAYGGAAGETGIEEDGVIGDVPSPAEYFLSNDRDLAEQPGYVPRGNISGLDDDKPLPDLPSEQGEDENDISDAQVSGCEQPSVLSTSESGRNDRELEKRFCVDFDFNPDVEEYYRTRARELRINQEGEKERELQNQTQRARADEALLEELRRTTPRISPPPRRRMPELRLQTAFPTESRQRPPEDSGVTGTEKGGNVVFQIPIVLFEDVERPTEGVQSGQDEEDNEDGELTARPKNGHPYALTAPPRRWNSVTIDEVLHDLEMRTSHLGPFTPRDYDDISPVTRGEWGHFLVEGGLRERTAAVEMC